MGSLLGLAASRGGAGPVVSEHEQADRRRQIALLAIGVDLTDKFGKRPTSLRRNRLHAIPERRFEADAGLVATDDDRAPHDWISPFNSLYMGSIIP